MAIKTTKQKESAAIIIPEFDVVFLLVDVFSVLLVIGVVVCKEALLDFLNWIVLKSARVGLFFWFGGREDTVFVALVVDKVVEAFVPEIESKHKDLLKLF